MNVCTRVSELGQYSFFIRTFRNRKVNRPPFIICVPHSYGTFRIQIKLLLPTLSSLCVVDRKNRFRMCNPK